MSSDPTLRFSDRVRDYVRHRPGYPSGVVALLEREIGLHPGHVIADVGSGTGLSAEPFLDHGNAVYGVEPNAAMRAAAEDLLRDRPRFTSIDGSAEATTLDDAAIDIVIAGQAFHWFDRLHTRTEFVRILRPGGRVVLLWNRRDIESTPFLRAYEALVVRFGTDYQQVRHDQIDEHAVEQFYRGPVSRTVLTNEQIFDYEGLAGRLRSSSYVPGPGHPDHNPMLAALRGLFEQYAEKGVVRFGYLLEVYWGRLP